jgi:iron-sulfur cluster repair protein YtfE (RIC family)
MRRHESLIPLTHDHHHALAQVRRMKVAADRGDREERLNRAREFLDFFRRETVHHFRIEEELIFPPLLDFFDERPELLVRALLEHLKIQSRVGRLGEEVQAQAVTEEALRDVAELLEAHIRLEEKELFPLIQEVVPEEALLKTDLALKRSSPARTPDDDITAEGMAPGASSRHSGEARRSLKGHRREGDL